MKLLFSAILIATATFASYSQAEDHDLTDKQVAAKISSSDWFAKIDPKKKKIALPYFVKTYKKYGQERVMLEGLGKCDLQAMQVDEAGESAISNTHSAREKDDACEYTFTNNRREKKQLHTCLFAKSEAVLIKEQALESLEANYKMLFEEGKANRLNSRSLSRAIRGGACQITVAE